ncbi:MAG: hypothetical protein KF849_07370 [Rhizobiaceae bacterium]|nr:hypothetical protein [Rhizobiaceae bacterium]
MSTIRPPSLLTTTDVGAALFDALGHEILQEKAAALGRAGSRAEEAVAKFKSVAADAPERPALRKEAARAVHAWFIQRELCGLRRHADVIRELGIPNEVLARLGAS